jgi:hypothetical protein
MSRDYPLTLKQFPPIKIIAIRFGMISNMKTTKNTDAFRPYPKLAPLPPDLRKQKPPITKRKVFKIIAITLGAMVILAVMGVILFVFFIATAVKDFENIDDLAILKQQSITQFVPPNVTQVGYSEINRSKENNQIIKSGNYDSSITRTFQYDPNTSIEKIAESLLDKAKADGWKVESEPGDTSGSERLYQLSKDCDTEKVSGKNCSIYIAKDKESNNTFTVEYAIY